MNGDTGQRYRKIDWEANRNHPDPPRWHGICPGTPYKRSCGRELARAEPAVDFRPQLPSPRADNNYQFPITLGPDYQLEADGMWWPNKPKQESYPGQPHYGERGRAYYQKTAGQLSNADGAGPRGMQLRNAETPKTRRRFEPPTPIARAGDLVVCKCGAVAQLTEHPIEQRPLRTGA